MTVATMIRDLAAQGVKLGIKGDRLRVEGPACLLTTALRAELLAHNAELLAVLRLGELSTDTTFVEAQVYFDNTGYRCESEERAAILESDGGNCNHGRRPLDVFCSSATPEWNTPRHVIDRVLSVLVSINLDPCSNSKADPNVPADTYYTKQDDGLKQPWNGRVYLNPPYGGQIERWVRKLHEAYQAGSVCEAVALLPARTDTRWFGILRPYPKCFITGRLKFGKARNSAPVPSVVVYLGDRPDRFAAAFSPLGDIYTRLPDGGSRSHKEYV